MRTIAKLAFKETLSKRIFLIAVLMTLAFLLFYGIAMHFASTKIEFDEGMAGSFQQSLVATELFSMGLFFANFICILLTILSGVSSISSEIDSHQIDTLLARPLRRSEVVFGKLIGLGGLLFAYAILLFFGVVAMNQLFGGAIRFDLQAGTLLQAIGLFSLEPLVLMAVALWLSSRLSTINGGIILIILFGIGFIGGFVEQIGTLLRNDALTNIGILSSLLFPLDSLFRKGTVLLFHLGSDPLKMAQLGPFGSISTPSALMVVYAVAYGAFFLWRAVRRFGKRDL